MKYDPQVTAEVYDKTAFHPLRIESITEQVRLLSRYPCQSVLEVGVGKGLIRQLFKCIPNIRYTCIDIAPDLEPDYVGSVLQMPFKDEEFDAILCCQVLEHLRLEDFLPALRELHRVSRRLVIMSLYACFDLGGRNGSSTFTEKRHLENTLAPDTTGRSGIVLRQQ
jgi:ubiquinone/menaquinone biosynthesis C-methylase UbiE